MTDNQRSSPLAALKRDQRDQPKTISTWPESEKPREKLLNQGAQTLSDAELLGIFIHTGIKGKTAVDIGRDLITQFGSLREVLISSQAAFCDVNGLGPAKYALIQASLEIGKRYLDQKLRRKGSLTSATQAAEFLTHKLRDQKREVFAIVYLDTRHQVIHYDELFFGTINGATIHPREVVKSVLHHNAAAVIIAHNHPSGIAEPSHSDNTITKRLIAALEMVEVRLLDHLVIGDGQYVSMADRGLI